MARLTVDTDINFSDPLSKRRFQTCVGVLQDEYEVLLKPIDEKRSNKQNRFFWRVICQSLAEWFTAQGQPMTKDHAKEMLCEEFLPVTFTDPVTGKVKTVGGSTSGLSKPKFSEFLELCIAWMVEHGIELPPPPPIQERNCQTGSAPSRSIKPCAPSAGDVGKRITTSRKETHHA